MVATYIFRLDFLKIYFLTCNLANYINLLNNWMAEYIIREADFSSQEENDVNVIDEESQEDWESYVSSFADRSTSFVTFMTTCTKIRYSLW